jgi:uncharacterized membrane protein YhhN
MTSRVVLYAYAVVGLANVAAELAGATTAIHLTKVLLMPLLLAWLLVTMHGQITAPIRWLAAGVVFAWMGDLLLMGDGDAFFIGGIAAFLLMQVCFIIAFTRVPGPGLVRAWKVALVPFVAVWLLLNILVSPGVGQLRIPVLVYSVVLVGMAVAALDLVIRVPQDKGWRVAIGAALFVVSDAFIALTAFGPLSESHVISAFIMATYIVAQGMIVTGFAACCVPRTTLATD